MAVQAEGLLLRDQQAPVFPAVGIMAVGAYALPEGTVHGALPDKVSDILVAIQTNGINPVVHQALDIADVRIVAFQAPALFKKDMNIFIRQVLFQFLVALVAEVRHLAFQFDPCIRIIAPDYEKYCQH